MASPYPQSLSSPLPLFRNPQTHQLWLTFNSFHTIKDHVWLPIYCRRWWEKRGKRDLGGGGGHRRWWEKKKKQSKIFMGLRGLDVRKDGFGGREMGLWVLRKRKRDFGVGGSHGWRWKKKFKKNWILIVCVWVYCFICKMLTWRFWIRGCKTQFYTSSLLNLISITNCCKYVLWIPCKERFQL